MDCSLQKRPKTYRHMNFFEHECHLHVRVPRIKRDDGRVKMILPPLAFLTVLLSVW
jgi:hypothetical protein